MSHQAKKVVNGTIRVIAQLPRFFRPAKGFVIALEVPVEVIGCHVGTVIGAKFARFLVRSQSGIAVLRYTPAIPQATGVVNQSRGVAAIAGSSEGRRHFCKHSVVIASSDGFE